MENLHIKPPHYLSISHSITNEEKEKSELEKEKQNQHASEVIQRRDEYMKNRGINIIRMDELSERNFAMTQLSQQYAHPRLQGGYRSLPLDHQLRYFNNSRK